MFPFMQSFAFEFAEFFQAGAAGSDFSMFDVPRTRTTITSPTSFLAQEVVGNEAHKMQLMKSSLFVEDNASEDESMGRWISC